MNSLGENLHFARAGGEHADNHLELQRGFGVIRPTGLIVAFEKVVQRDDRSIRDDKIYKRRELPFELRLRF